MRISGVSEERTLISPRLIHANDDPHKCKQAQHQKDLPCRDSRRARLRPSRTCSPFINLDRAPENQNQRPPAQDDSRQFKAAIVVQQQQQADEDEDQSAENAAAARAKSGHEWLLSMARQ